jgi:XTP/dITP diphosphohydrolase
MKIVFATNNAHKLSEVKAVLGEGFELVTLKEVGITEDIPETGETLDENASIKARYVYERTGLDCFADDTGLEVAALNGAPGVRSARYATDGHDFAANNRKLLRELEGVADRSARFRTVISLIINGEEQQVEGIVRGTIATEESGCEGFGYDPLFIPEGKSVTFAEMSADEKNAISHRGRAVAELVKILKKIESLYF